MSCTQTSKRDYSVYFQTRKQAIIRKSVERDAKLVEIRTSKRSSTGVYGFGSRTSRMLDPLDSIDQSKRAVSHGSLLRSGAGPGESQTSSGTDASGHHPSLRAQRRAVSACNLASGEKSLTASSKQGMLHAFICFTLHGYYFYLFFFFVHCFDHFCFFSHFFFKKKKTTKCYHQVDGFALSSVIVYSIFNVQSTCSAQIRSGLRKLKIR